MLLVEIWQRKKKNSNKIKTTINLLNEKRSLISIKKMNLALHFFKFSVLL